MHVHMNVGTCVHASVNACVSMYLEARVSGRCIIPSLSILYFEAGSLLYPELTDLSNQLVFFFFFFRDSLSLHPVFWHPRQTSTTIQYV